jgi:curved DNA-binding protein CbpA
MAKSQEVCEQDERSAELNAYELLHLLPSAPQELIVEVYWRLVHQLQAAAREDLNLRPKLDQLNEAYAAVVDPEARAEYELYRARSPGPVDAAEAGSRTGGVLRRLWKRQPARSSPQCNPWQFLHLDPNAPPDIAELAYGFWRTRLRSQWGDSAPAELEKVGEAYEALRNGEVELPAEASTATDVEPDTDAAEVDELSQKRTSPIDLSRASRSAVAMSASLGRWSSDAARAGWERRSSLAQAWRSAVATSVSFGRSTRDVASAAWERLPTLSDDRSVDRLHGYPVDTPEPAGEEVSASRDISGPAPHPGVEQRLAALAASTSKATDLGIVHSELTRDGATEAPPGEGEPDDESAGPPTEPSATPPLRSETIRQVQSSQVAQPSEARAHLVTESGPALGVGAAIGPGPFTIGTDSRSDLVVPASDGRETGVLGRIWSQEGRFMFHSMGRTPAVLVNGQSSAWALLEDGDRLQIGDHVFRFERIPRSGMDADLDPRLTDQLDGDRGVA